MEDFSAEEEEPWYDQQDLEQGERGVRGQQESGVRPATLSASPLLSGVILGRAGLNPTCRTPRRCFWRMGTWRGGALPGKTQTLLAETCKSLGSGLPHSLNDRDILPPVHPLHFRGRNCPGTPGIIGGPEYWLEVFGGREVAPRSSFAERGGVCI